MKHKIEHIKEIVLRHAGCMLDKKIRIEVAKLIQDIFSGSRITDITTPTDCDELKITFAIELPNGKNSMLIIDTMNGLTKEDINITIL